MAKRVFADVIEPSILLNPLGVPRRQYHEISSLMVPRRAIPAIRL
jgi:hypothetical protein